MPNRTITRYVVLKRIKVGEEWRLPGDACPEANVWPNVRSYVRGGFLEARGDLEVDEAEWQRILRHAPRNVRNPDALAAEEALSSPVPTPDPASAPMPIPVAGPDDDPPPDPGETWADGGEPPDPMASSAPPAPTAPAGRRRTGGR